MDERIAGGTVSRIVSRIVSGVVSGMMSGEFYFYTKQMDVGYDGKVLIRDVRITLQRGEILTLIGPNGAGKSTILKSITRQLKLIGGNVYIGGEDMLRMSGNEIAKKQAVVLTERMHPELMTCEDVVSTGRYPYTGTLGLLGEEDKKKVRDALELVHALDLKDRDFNAISDGQRQRVLLARAIAQEPELIILDEPTSFLDVRHKLEFLSILRKMVRENAVAVIMSLHELDLAQKISDRIMCVNGPVIARYGTAEEIFESDYIRDLYGIRTGSYDTAFGCMELPAPQGEPQVFVIAGGGSGIPVYRRLQRENIPFVTGILQENDIDYEAARHLATGVISSPAYEPVSEAAYVQAEQAMKACQKVICTLEHFGAQNECNRRLMELSRCEGTLEETVSGVTA